MTDVKIRFLTAALALTVLVGSASAQRIGMYPLDSTDRALSLAVPTAIQRSLETIDGVIIPAPRDLFEAVQQRPAFQETLDKVFGLDILVKGKLEGSAGAYTVTFSIKRGTATQTAIAKGTDFVTLVRNANVSLLAALGLKPTSIDAAQLASVERALPSAEVVTATGELGNADSKSVLERAGQNPWALAGRALVLVGERKNDEALALVTPAAKAAPNDPFVQAVQIIALIATRKFAEAKTTIEATLKLNPAKPEIHFLNGTQILRATTPLTEEVVQRALNAFQLALQYNPRYLEAAVSAADVLEQYGNAERAVSVLTNLVARMPDNTGLHNRVLDTLLELDRDGAVGYLREVIKTYPDVADSVYALAWRLFDTEAANSIVADGETRYPTSSPLAFARAYLLERIGSYLEAAAAYRQSLERDPKYTRASLALAATLSKLGKFDEAETALKAASPSNDQKLVARMYLQTGRLDKAKAILAKLPVSDMDVVYFNGIVALREYRADDASKAFDAAIKLAPSNNQIRISQTEVPDVRRLGVPKLTGEALYQFRLGLGLIDAGNPLEAVTAMNRAVKLAPNDLHALLYRAVALLRTVDPDEARVAFDAVLKVAPNNAVVQTFVAVAELGRGRYDLAIEAANKAIGFDKTYARAYFVLGNIYFQQYNLFGTVPDAVLARDAFTRCIAADPNYKILAERFISNLVNVK